uniref:WD_REPEATS_REGION domain-containing protein n=1 Tax=Macrostomum lignano TaxID=282301 RepID=A0A1I8IHP3_9PLAT
MNLELLESFHKNYPEENDGVLDCVSFAVTCAFNRFGTLLAVGCNDGRVVIWDFLTRGIAKTITAHAVTVCSVSWSRDSKKLLTASTDNTVALWDVLSGECDKVFRFPSPVLKCSCLSPPNSQRLLVCPMRHPPVLVDAETGSHSCLPPDEEGEFSTAAAFNSRGDHVYVGNSRAQGGRTRTLRQVAALPSHTGHVANTAVKSIEFARKQRNFLLNCSDSHSARVLLRHRAGGQAQPGGRAAAEAERAVPPQHLRAICQPVTIPQDLVTGNHWRKCCFSGDGEFAHSIYIWDRIGGAMVKMLQGTKGETLLDVVQNWSAFAPDFKELDENVEYEERESEFDLSDEDAEPKAAAVPSASNSDEEVDVERCEPVQALLSSDEEADPDMLLFLPVAPEVICRCGDWLSRMIASASAYL